MVETAQEVPYAFTSMDIGEVMAYDSVELIARVSGFLRECNFNEGDPVKAGDQLFLIEQEQYKSSLKQSEAQLKKAQADLKNAEIDYTRQKSLLGNNAVSKKNYDDAEAKKMQSEADVLFAEAALDQAKLNLSYTKIIAPFDGFIGYKKYSVGNLVGPTSAVLATVNRAGPVKVRFSISEPNMLRLMREYGTDESQQEKIPVTLYFQDGVEYSHPGKIESWDNQINPGTGTFKLQAVFENPEGELVPGMFVKVKIQLEKPVKKLFVSTVSMISDQTGDYVIVVQNDNSAIRRRVKILARAGDKTILQSGLNPGEKIIKNGLQKLMAPGMKVNPVPEGTNPVKTGLPPAAAKGESGKPSVVSGEPVKTSAAPTPAAESKPAAN